jgi:hypothetical protein
MHTVLDEHAGVQTRAASAVASLASLAPASLEEVVVLASDASGDSLVIVASPPSASVVVVPSLEDVASDTDASMTGSTTGTLVLAPVGGGSLIIPALLTCDIGAQ